MSLEYRRSKELLSNILGRSVFEEVSKYLHEFDGTEYAVKPVAKHVTIYWVGRNSSEMVIRTEGEDDIIVTEVRGNLLPTLIFRKVKATLLREYARLLRLAWNTHSIDVKGVLLRYKDYYGDDYDFMKCSISPGIEGGEAGRSTVMQERCMMCPLDVLMGAVAGKKTAYNLASRVAGDPAYATTPSFDYWTGNAVDEVTYTTGMGGVKSGKVTGETTTGALFTETPVYPNTIFIGKTVLFMPSPPELVYMLKMHTEVLRFGARRTIRGTMEIRPVVLVAGPYEAGTTLTAVEHALNVKDMETAVKLVTDYVLNEAISSNHKAVPINDAMLEKIVKGIDLTDKGLYLELWENASNFVVGVHKYLSPKK